MELKDLFVSYKQVDPVEHSFVKPDMSTMMYVNIDRAQKVAERDWKAGDSESTIRNWVVGTKKGNTDSQDPQNPNNDSNPVQDSKKPSSENDSDKSIVQLTTPAKRNSGVKLSMTWVNPYANNKELWISDMRKAYQNLGLSDNAIKNLLAKNALESGWGRSAQGAFNFGNITPGKYWSGNYVEGKDKDSQGRVINQKFRAYGSLDEFVKDEVDFLTRLYDFDPNDNIDMFLHKLQGGNKDGRRYAAALDYKDIVKSVYKSI